ncbi:hypothetical protein DFP72DRAFT_1071072 [Ephemerocybe angulata]|uniref:Uncharacterized protein n=1 Tax=Ephemerocybe angulata TaxID=980116 RepID=A0A8H6HST7_9AGAR|nr:hypothetical protein DFP72DRAFT_1071072 [Tulosesus angulatus]
MINVHLLSETEAEFALSHDDDWRFIAEGASPKDVMSDEALQSIFRGNSIMTRHGVAFLEPRDTTRSNQAACISAILLVRSKHTEPLYLRSVFLGTSLWAVSRTFPTSNLEMFSFATPPNWSPELLPVYLDLNTSHPDEQTAVEHSSSLQQFLSLDLNPMQQIRVIGGSTLISYDPSTFIPPPLLTEVTNIRGQSCHAQTILRHAASPILVLMSLLWHTLRACDDAVEFLYASRSSLVFDSGGPRAAHKLHTLRRHCEHYTMLLDDTIEDAPSVIETFELFANDQDSSFGQFLQQECANLFAEAERLQGVLSQEEEKVRKLTDNTFPADGSPRYIAATVTRSIGIISESEVATKPGLSATSGVGRADTSKVARPLSRKRGASKGFLGLGSSGTGGGSWGTVKKDGLLRAPGEPLTPPSLRNKIEAMQAKAAKEHKPPEALWEILSKGSDTKTPLKRSRTFGKSMGVAKSSLSSKLVGNMTATNQSGCRCEEAGCDKCKCQKITNMLGSANSEAVIYINATLTSAGYDEAVEKNMKELARQLLALFNLLPSLEFGPPAIFKGLILNVCKLGTLLLECPTPVLTMSPTFEGHARKMISYVRAIKEFCETPAKSSNSHETPLDVCLRTVNYWEDFFYVHYLNFKYALAVLEALLESEDVQGTTRELVMQLPKARQEAVDKLKQHIGAAIATQGIQSLALM